MGADDMSSDVEEGCRRPNKCPQLNLIARAYAHRALQERPHLPRDATRWVAAGSCRQARRRRVTPLGNNASFSPEQRQRTEQASVKAARQRGRCGLWVVHASAHTPSLRVTRQEEATAMATSTPLESLASKQPAF